jgi:hypothetical protein
MRDSNVANAAKESAQDEFPHGLEGFCRGGPRGASPLESFCAFEKRERVVSAELAIALDDLTSALC